MQLFLISDIQTIEEAILYDEDDTCGERVNEYKINFIRNFQSVEFFLKLSIFWLKIVNYIVIT